VATGGLDAEVGGNDFGVSANVIETAPSEHLSLGHNHDIVSDHRQEAHVVCDYQNRHVLVDDLLDSIRDEYRRLGEYTCSGFIKEEQLGMCHQSPGVLHEASLTA
jgi:hypothetical protein